MQLYALDQGQNVIFVEQAQRGLDYCCPECRSAVRLRGGSHRRTHFYHLSLEACRQSAKSMEHLQVQWFLKDRLPGEVTLEKRFASINRIADVVWEEEKIIFEVQCSPIPASEVKERNSDYAKAGYEVIWLLHDKNFNQKRLTAAEHFLKGHPHYRTSIDEEGKGEIYDADCGDKRPLALKLSKSRLKGIRAKWRRSLEGSFEPSEIPLKRTYVKRWLYHLFQLLLESVCK